jgi:hypothetical protein
MAMAMCQPRKKVKKMCDDNVLTKKRNHINVVTHAWKQLGDTTNRKLAKTLDKA